MGQQNCMSLKFSPKICTSSVGGYSGGFIDRTMRLALLFLDLKAKTSPVTLGHMQIEHITYVIHVLQFGIMNLDQ